MAGAEERPPRRVRAAWEGRVREAYAGLDGAWHPLARLRGDAIEALPEGEEALKARVAPALAAAPHQLEDALREAEQALAAQQPG